MRGVRLRFCRVAAFAGNLRRNGRSMRSSRRRASNTSRTAICWSIAGADLRLTQLSGGKKLRHFAGRPALNHASISYEEARVGAGLDWKLSTAVKLSFEGGYIPFRDFDFHRTQVRYHQDGGAPYARIGFHAAF